MDEWEALVRITLAATLGGLIGLERETLNKAAGLRTHMLVALGAALFMATSILLVGDFATVEGQVRIDPTRIGSTIVTGIGFLGGGIIFRDKERIRGLTTAAGLWVAASIGMATGAGYYLLSIGGTGMTLVVLVLMRRIEIWTDFRRHQTYRDLPWSSDDE
jgi:putative Mg2+ transporter-C (MgtC) family protein